MTEIYVDPYVLACPRPGSAEIEYKTYVTTLTELQNTRSQGCVKLLVPSNAINVLEAAGALPPWEKSELDIYVQREEVSRLLYALLTKLSTIEDFLEVADILVDQGKCEPATHLKDRVQDFIENYHRTLGLVCLGIDLKRSKDGKIVITKGLEEAVLVRASGQIVIAEFLNQTTAILLPHEYAKDVINVPSMRILCTVLDPISIWKSGYIRKAIDLARFLLEQQEGETWPNVEYAYRIHPGFEETIGILDTDTKISMTLRACAEALLDENLRDTHALRESAGGNSPQLTRGKDKATAWRRDIDREYHLHYWRTSTEIEFASVVQHNDFGIPE